MFIETKFDPEKDIQAVVPNLAIDLEAAIDNGVVVDTGVIAEYNDIDSPSNILCRIHDTFEAMDLQKAISANMKAAKAKSEAKAEVRSSANNASTSNGEGD